MGSMQPQLSKTDIARDFNFMFAFWALVIVGVSAFFHPLIWALPVWVGVWVVVRWPGVAKRVLAWIGDRFRRLLDLIIIRALPQPKPSNLQKMQFAPERQRPSVTLQFAEVGERKRFWTGVSDFGRMLANFPFLWVGAAVLFGLAWGEFRGHWMARERVHEIRNEYAVADARAAERAREAAKDISAIGARTQERRDRIETIAQRGRDEIRRATPPREAAIDPALVAGWRCALDELLIARADGSLADSCP